MLTLLKIRNVALIDELEVEFGPGLNLLTGETGSGKSIIVDSLGALTGDRVSSDLIKQGESTARIEGVFAIDDIGSVASFVEETGLDLTGNELIVRRDVSGEGRNRVFINDQLVTLSLLKRIGRSLVDIHGQGEQTMLYDVTSHGAMLDDFAEVAEEKVTVADIFAELTAIRSELASLKNDEAEKLQLIDILRFQRDDIQRAALRDGEDAELEDEKRRLNNVEKLSSLSSEAHTLLYDDQHSTLTTLDKAAKIVAELSEYDDRFRGFEDSLEAARAVVSELGATARDFGASLEFSPDRLNEIEDRLAEISRLKRKYGDSTSAVLAHLVEVEKRLENIELSEFREEELNRQLAATSARFDEAAQILHAKRSAAAKKFSKAVESELGDVALDKAKFKIEVERTTAQTASGTDRVEFYFSANPGEPPRPLAKIASGGEASRLMLILKTVSRSRDTGKSAVFDEIDIGIGGRVAEAVGRKLKALSARQQVFCVTHQPQIASLADRHFVVEKKFISGTTRISVRELSASERVEELARMLAGEQVTEQARENARAMLAAAK